MIVAFDTNVLVSAVATRGLCADLLHATLAEHQLVVGETALAELRQALLQKLRLPGAVADEMESFLRWHATIMPRTSALDVRGLDHGDLAILSESIAGKADALVTGDQALLAIGAHATMKILSPRGFWELLRSA